MSFDNRVIKIISEEGVWPFFYQSWQFMKERLQPIIELPEAAFRKEMHRLRYCHSFPPSYRIINIDPNSVQFLVTPNFYTSLSRRGTHIIDGEWDKKISNKSLMYHGGYENVDEHRKLISFDDYGFYRSCDAHFNHGVSWENTNFYQWLLEDRDKRISRYRTKAQIDDRTTFLDELYEDMKEEGYKTQRKLNDKWTPFGYDEVLINIGRNGKFIFEDGRHRFVIAKLLGIETIPVRIFVRHYKWQALRKQISDEGWQVLSNKPNIRIEHPDLQDVRDTTN